MYEIKILSLDSFEIYQVENSFWNMFFIEISQVENKKIEKIEKSNKEKNEESNKDK